MSKTGQFSTMSDDQFRHVISQLPLSGRTATTTRATRGSSSSTPQPAPMLMLAPPSYVPQYPQGQQPPQPQTQMQMQNQIQQTQTRYQHYQIPQPQLQSQPPAVAPVVPVAGTPISSSAQAYFTSYSSRLRTGATLLVQPTLFPGSTTTGAATAANSTSFPLASTSSSSTLGTTTRPTRASRRSRGTVINYAEVDDEGDDDEGDGDDANDTKKDGDHIPDAGALDDDATDGDFVAGNGSGRRVGRPSKQQQQVRVDSSDLDQSYLGQVPLSRFIRTRGFLSNAATAQGGPMFALDYGPNYLSSLPLPSPPHPNPILIPVRLEFDVPELGLRIRDVFLWNLHKPSSSGITPEVFAAQFCRDLDIGVDPYGEMVARQIRAQVEDARGEAWVGWMDSLGFSGPLDDDYDDDEDLDLNQHQDSLTQNTNPECRVILSLDVQISTHHLTDHIEWDLLSPLTPEAFSLQLCADLGLSGEAIPLIAHAVHEELCRHRRDVVDWGVLGALHPPLNSNSNSGIGGSVGDSEGPIKDRTGLGLGSLGRPARERDGRYPKPLRSAWRDWAEAEEYATRWEVLSPEEVERREVERERAGRRLRRETSKWRSRR
ncbi:SNF5-domain-containing protein [Lentinula edodes]|uniref:SNF5-domain-containing protein n=1 Tax=Lentinula edodes TaxID=5353 RepID=A0A1Q3DUN0_LENED|nr:SNF5-domain-containing protein [Lentinula edodes]